MSEAPAPLCGASLASSSPAARGCLLGRQRHVAGQERALHGVGRPSDGNIIGLLQSNENAKKAGDAGGPRSERGEEVLSWQEV